MESWQMLSQQPGKLLAPFWDQDRKQGSGASSRLRNTVLSSSKFCLESHHGVSNVCSQNVLATFCIHPLSHSLCSQSTCHLVTPCCLESPLYLSSVFLPKCLNQRKERWARSQNAGPGAFTNWATVSYLTFLYLGYLLYFICMYIHIYIFIYFNIFIYINTCIFLI